MRSIFGCTDCKNMKHRYRYKRYYGDINDFVCKKRESEKYNKHKTSFMGYFRGVDGNHKQLYCHEFKWDILKAIRHILRQVFYVKIYLNLELQYELWCVRRDCNRRATLSAYGVQERGTIKGEIPRKYKGTIEDMKKFETNYINFTKKQEVWAKEGRVKIMLYNKYLTEEGIDLDKVPFEWNIKSKRINKKLNKSCLEK